MIAIETIKEISAQIVMGWPYNSDYEWHRLNTFAVIKNRSDWSDATFGNDSSAKSNDFISRAGEKRKSGYLIFENHNANGKINTGTLCTDLWFSVAFDPKCHSTCELSKHLGRHGIYLQAVTTLRQFLAEFATWNKYEVELTNGVFKNMWMTEAVKNKKEADVVQIVKQCGTMQGLIASGQNKDVEYYENEFGTSGLIGASVKVRICSCEPLDKIKINCDYEKCEEKGMLVCPCE